MIQTVEAVIDPSGAVRLLEPVQVSAPRRALLTILPEEPPHPNEATPDEDWQRFGKAQLARAYGPDEPEYTATDLEPAADLGFTQGYSSMSPPKSCE